MPLLTDIDRVRALLDRDRNWGAYAIGDLDPALIGHCTWYAPASSAAALLLVYRGFDPPITFAMGHAQDLRALFNELSAPEISLHMRPEAIAAMSGVYIPTDTRLMRRMVLRPATFRPAPVQDVQPVGERDVAAVSALYEDGHRRGQGPSFFSPAMLQQRTFRGVWEDGALVAIAGTHLYSTNVGVCAIGNVYTRSDRRGRGLAARVTSAVALHAIDTEVPTIVLNVGHDNAPAQRVYERLGFELHCEFLEGTATRAPGVVRHDFSASIPSDAARGRPDRPDTTRGDAARGDESR